MMKKPTAREVGPKNGQTRSKCPQGENQSAPWGDRLKIAQLGGDSTCVAKDSLRNGELAA